MKDIKITKVKLVNNGLKGIEVNYLATEKTGDREFFNEYISKRKAPIHAELEETFSWLKNHILDICGYSLDETERTFHLNRLEMVSVSYDPSKGFVLAGSLQVMTGDKSINIVTPLVGSDDYTDYGKVTAIIEGIFSETKEYMSFKKTLDDVQLVMKFNKKNEDFDPEAFKKLTKKKQRDFATKILEDQKCVVIHTDLESEPVMLDEVDFSVTEEEEQIEEPIHEEPVAEIQEEDDDFSLSIKIPVAAKSTAKRK